MKARRILEQVTAIGVALAGDPETVGKLRIAAGEDVRTVGRWVQNAKVEKRMRELEPKE